jgi:predicted RNA methylase
MNSMWYRGEEYRNHDGIMLQPKVYSKLFQISPWNKVLYTVYNYHSYTVRRIDLWTKGHQVTVTSPVQFKVADEVEGHRN